MSIFQNISNSFDNFVIWRNELLSGTIFEKFTNINPTHINPIDSIGSFFGGVALIALVFLAIKSAISGDEGFKTIKKLAFFSLIPAGLYGIAQLINLTDLESGLTNFFIVIRRLLIVFDFAVNTDLLVSLMLTTLGIAVAYWSWRAYKFTITFFNER